MLISPMERLAILPFSGCQGAGRGALHSNSAGRLIYRQLMDSQLPISSLLGVESLRWLGLGAVPGEWRPGQAARGVSARPIPSMW